MTAGRWLFALIAAVALAMSAARADDGSASRPVAETKTNAVDDPESAPRSDEDAPAPVTADGSGVIVPKEGPYGGTNMTQCKSGLPAPC